MKKTPRRELAFDEDPSDRRWFWFRLVLKTSLFFVLTAGFLGLIVYARVHG